ncbi:MAG TPA: hypothetical protein VIG76_04190 [Amnibacterium sp.]|uniref:hypothetical protein n=1 Tax=Amnibacterium sp. TaxID=1872496 RepID=UPI002F938F9E
MPHTSDPAVDLTRSDRRMASALARLAVGTVVVAVPVALVLSSVHAAHEAGTAAVRTALTAVSTALTTQHAATGTWPGDLLAVGGAVVDDSGQHLTTIPAGVGLAYERSLDGSRAVVTLSDHGAEAVFDSATAGR